MTFRKVTTAVVPACNRCEFDCWGDKDAAPLYRNEKAARKAVVENHKWRIERHPTTDRIRIFCPNCAGLSDCELFGHNWHRPHVDPDADLPVPREHCTRCPTVRLEEKPPGHPESMTVKLPKDQEEWLAALAAEWEAEAA